MSLPKWVILQLLEHCNLRCRMCYEWGENGPYREKTDLAVDWTSRSSRGSSRMQAGPTVLRTLRRRATLYPHIEEVLRAIKSAGSKVQLPTNGTLLAKHAELLVETAPERIWVSLDGPPEINDRQRGDGVFARAVEGIDRLHALRERRGRSLSADRRQCRRHAAQLPASRDFLLRGARPEQAGLHQPRAPGLSHRAGSPATTSVVLRREFGVAAAPWRGDS